jgi:beta-lactamase class D
MINYTRICMLGAALATASAQAKVVCTVIADAGTGSVLMEQGDCRTRVTPASTFKVALSVMGYDAGFLKDDHSPVLQYKKGDVDWGGENWRQPTDPARWLEYSVVWYSQRITHAIGAQRLQQYVRDFGYGNADVSGDAGQDNGLDRSWIGSSLKISPVEQVAFLRKLVRRELPVSASAFDMTSRIVMSHDLPNGWRVHGKTGSGTPKPPERKSGHAVGWFVGWMTKGDRTLVFARLTRDEKPMPGTAGVRAREAFLKEAPALLGGLVPRT